MLADSVGAALCAWTAGLGRREALIEVYRRIRDIPYAIVPELVDPTGYVRILEVGKGSCSPKHFLLCNMFQRLGVEVLYAVFPFEWGASGVLYPDRIKRLAAGAGQGYHLACRVAVEGRLALVDATLDPPLRKLGLPVNPDWDGRSDTLLPMVPGSPELLYHPSEAALMPVPILDEASAAFYRELNAWLETARL